MLILLPVESPELKNLKRIIYSDTFNLGLVLLKHENISVNIPESVIFYLSYVTNSGEQNMWTTVSPKAVGVFGSEIYYHSGPVKDLDQLVKVSIIAAYGLRHTAIKQRCERYLPIFILALTNFFET